MLQRILEWSATIYPALRSLQHAFLFQELCKQVPSLSQITPYSDLPLEFFLPHIRGGVITGRSSLVYGCLYERVPVYNCDDEEIESEKPESIDLYHYYCGVDPCHGEYVFDPKVFERIPDSARKADIISVLQSLMSEPIEVIK
jgi:hypothetical protein